MPYRLYSQKEAAAEYTRVAGKAVSNRTRFGLPFNAADAPNSTSHRQNILIYECALQRSGLPQPIRNAIGIWTHVAGQTMQNAPSPLALVPALIHHIGAWYPVGGIGRIPEKLTDVARQLGVEFFFDNRVTAIHCNGREARGIQTEANGFVAGDAVVTDTNGVGAYLELLDGRTGPISERTRKRLERLALQSCSR